MDETDYHDQCDSVFARLEAMLDEAEVDFDSDGNVIEAELESGGKLIINRQAPAREIWLAAPDGGRHFRWHSAESNWRDTKDDRELMQVISELIA